MLEFHAPVDGPRATELRRLLTGPKDVVEQSIKVGQGGDMLWGYGCRLGLLYAVGGDMLWGYWQPQLEFWGHVR